MALQKNKFKIILIGDGGVGKTSYIQRYLEGNFLREYHATIGADVSTIQVKLNNQQIVLFEMWDIAGQEQNSCLDDAYYLGADGCIVMFDLTSRITATHIAAWIRKVRNVDPGRKIPIICVGNKADSKQRMAMDRFIKLIPSGLKYEDLSVKSNLKIDVPLIWLSEYFTGIKGVSFEARKIRPEIDIDEECVVESAKVAGDVNKQLAEVAACMPFAEDEEAKGG